MGDFANTLFSVLLGWVQSIAAWLWQFFTGGGGEGMVAWLLDHWLLLTIVLCAAGVAIDVLVYLLRWQPYRVWHSFWQRRKEEAEAAEAEEEEMQWLYPDGRMVMDEPVQAPMQTAAQEDLQLSGPIHPVQRVIPARRRRASAGAQGYVLPSGERVQQAYNRPYYPPQWRSGEHQGTNGGMKP